MDSFLKSYEFEHIKGIVLQNVEQFIANKIKKTELTEVFNQKLTSEKLIRKELRYLSINSKTDQTSWTCVRRGKRTSAT